MTKRELHEIELELEQISFEMDCLEHHVSDAEYALNPREAE